LWCLLNRHALLPQVDKTTGDTMQFAIYIQNKLIARNN